MIPEPDPIGFGNYPPNAVVSGGNTVRILSIFYSPFVLKIQDHVESIHGGLG